MAIEVGMKHEKKLQTGPEHSAQKFFHGVPEVFGTPFLGGCSKGPAPSSWPRTWPPASSRWASP